MSKVTIRKMQGPLKRCPVCGKIMDQRVLLIRCQMTDCDIHMCPTCYLKKQGYCTRHYNRHQQESAKLQAWNTLSKQQDSDGSEVAE